MNRNPVVNAVRTPQPNSFNRCSRPSAATKARMKPRCKVCDAANPRVKRPRFAFNQLVAAAGQSWESASARNAHKKRTNEIRAVVRIATRISVSSITTVRPLSQTIRQQPYSVNLTCPVSLAPLCMSRFKPGRACPLSVQSQSCCSLVFPYTTFERPFIHGQWLLFTCNEHSGLQAHPHVLAIHQREAEPQEFSYPHWVVVYCQSAIEFRDFSSGWPSPEFDSRWLQRGLHIHVDSGGQVEDRLRKRRSDTYKRRGHQCQR